MDKKDSKHCPVSAVECWDLAFKQLKKVPAYRNGTRKERAELVKQQFLVNMEKMHRERQRSS